MFYCCSRKVVQIKVHDEPVRLRYSDPLRVPPNLNYSLSKLEMRFYPIFGAPDPNKTQFRSAAKRIRNRLSTRGRLQSGLIVQMEPERISHRVCVEPQREKESTAEAASAVLCFVRSCPHRVRVWSESKERKERRRARKERTLMEGGKREGVRGRKRGQGKG
jgi:hypothetical protein